MKINTMKPILIILLFVAQLANAQSYKKWMKDINKSVSYLASDQLEGRRAGTKGEALAADFISNRFKHNGLLTFDGLDNYIQPFEINDGLKIEDESYLTINNQTLKLYEDYIPLPFSKVGEDKIGYNSIVFYNTNDLVVENEGNPHFDLQESLYQKIKVIHIANPQSVLLLYNTKEVAFAEKFDEKSKKDQLSSFVFYCSNNAIEKIKKNNETLLSFNVRIVLSKRTGHNIVGHINNNAEKTIIIGAHYDHLGYGEDHNSLYVGKEKQIHNGADDNASGTAALLLLSKILNQKKYNKYNYVFIAFSGEELGLYGSKYFVEHSPIDLKKINFMINMDMIGRLNDSTHGLTIGGYGTSPEWGKIISVNNDYFKIKVDSAGSGPSDHTSFYRKDIPVLFFFTGTHSDYHKPTDDANKINYAGEAKIVDYMLSIITASYQYNSISFSKTRESAATGKSSFKVTMGIMPDYTFSGNGVLVDGVSDNRPAQKAGVKTGDIIQELGGFVIEDVQTYMQALNKFNKGDEVEVKIKRGNESVTVKVVF